MIQGMDFKAESKLGCPMGLTTMNAGRPANVLLLTHRDWSTVTRVDITRRSLPLHPADARLSDSEPLLM